MVPAKDVAALNTALKEMSDYEKEFNGNMEMVKERFLGKKSDVDECAESVRGVETAP